MAYLDISCADIFVCVVDINCGGHFFLRTYIVSDITFAFFFCGHMLLRTFLYLADTTGSNKAYYMKHILSI